MAIKHIITPGQRFTHWSVIREVDPIPRQDGHRLRRILCRCDCGTERVVLLMSLRKGASTCCGCIGNQKIGARRRTHGQCADYRRTKTYDVWNNMMARCYNPKGSGYENYGGRGIKVCERWRDFKNFYADMGERPAGKSLDRIDNDGHYAPENCAWRSAAEQIRNRRTTVRLTWQGETLTVPEWAERLGVTYKFLEHRREMGWSVERIFSQPKGRRIRK